MSIGKKILYFILIFITMTTVAAAGWLLPVNTGYPVFDIIIHIMMILDLEVCTGIFCVMVSAFVESMQRD